MTKEEIRAILAILWRLDEETCEIFAAQQALEGLGSFDPEDIVDCAG